MTTWGRKDLGPGGRGSAGSWARPRAFVLGWTIALASLSPAVASAQAEPSPPTATSKTDETEDVEGGDRRIKDHVFIFPGYVSTAVVASYVGVRARLGVSNVDNVPSEAGPLNIEAVTLAEGLDAGVKITDWFGLFATAGFRSLVGSNLRALVYDGATYDMGAGGGPIVRLFRSEKLGSQLSLLGSFGYSRGQIVSLYPIFDRPVLSIVEALRRELGESIKTPFSTLTYGGRLAFAQSISRWLGIQASAGLGGSTVTSEPYDRIRNVRGSATANDVTYTLGIAPSIDLSAFKVPLAVMPEYVYARAASSAQIRGGGDFDTYHQLAAGVYYSGRTNLQLGLLWVTQLGLRPLQVPLGVSGTPKQHAGELILRYVW